MSAEIPQESKSVRYLCSLGKICLQECPGQQRGLAVVDYIAVEGVMVAYEALLTFWCGMEPMPQAVRTMRELYAIDSAEQTYESDSIDFR